MTDGGATIDGWVCPMPLRDQPNIVMGHGGGGKLSAELIEHLFLPADNCDTLRQVLDRPHERQAAGADIALGELVADIDNANVGCDPGNDSVDHTNELIIPPKIRKKRDRKIHGPGC